LKGCQHTNVDEMKVFNDKFVLAAYFRSSKFLKGWSTIPISHILML